MRLVFLYMQEKAGDAKTPWDMNKPSTNKYAQSDGLVTEGYYYMLHKMLEKGIIDDLIIFIESARGSGKVLATGSIPCYVVPHISMINQFLKEDDVIFVRGGFKSWYEQLIEWGKKHWLLLYAANTGRQRWTFWNVVFNDLDGRFEFDRSGRFQYYFKKCVNESIFYPEKMNRIYDLCIGSSYIHDRKAQYKVVDALIEYKKEYGHDLKCVLPGAVRHSTFTNTIANRIRINNLNITMPGMLPRQELRKVYNQSKIMVHVGSGGQNDRGPLEAMACGTPVLLYTTKYRAPFTYDNPEVSMLTKHADDPLLFARDIRKATVDLSNEKTRRLVSSYYYEKNSLNSVILPEMNKLFSFFRNNLKPDIVALKKEYKGYK